MNEESSITPGQSATFEAQQLLEAIREILDDHQAGDVVTIDLEGKSTIGDYMVIATCRSQRQMAAIAEHIVRRLKSFGQIGVRPEGLRHGDWVLIDARDVIVHLFRDEARAFYNLEKMWGVDAPAGDRSSELGG